MENEILFRNCDALARISTLFVTTFGFADDPNICEAANKACVTAVNEWYKDHDQTIDFEKELIKPEALAYAGMMLLKIKMLADAHFKAMNGIRD